MADAFEQLEQMRKTLQESMPNGPADLKTACSLADLACQAVALLAHRPPTWDQGYASCPEWLLEIPDWMEPEPAIAKASKATRRLSRTLYKCEGEARRAIRLAAEEDAAEEAAAARDLAFLEAEAGIREAPDALAEVA